MARVPGPRRLAPRLVALVALAALVALLAWLGGWQLRRYDETRALEAAVERASAAPVALPPAAAAERYRHVELTGRYDAARQILLDNMMHAGQPGYRVLTPFATADGTTVLVDRGWVPLGASRAELPSVAVGGQERTIAGRLDELPRAGIAPPASRASGWPRVLNYPPLAALSAALAEPLYPRLVLLDAAAPDGYLRDWHPTGLSAERHFGYAVQWYALAVTLIVLYAARLTKRRAAG